MKVAFIPPFAYMELARMSPMQMCLAHLARDNTAYRDYFVLEAMRTRGSYIILDNGANEDSQVTPQELIDLRYKFTFHEVVVPDVMRDREGTVEAAAKFIESGAASILPCRLGFVLQGTCVEDAIQCYKDLVKAVGRLYIETVYIPRHLVTLNNKEARIVIAERLLRERLSGVTPIHFLGASPLWSTEVREAARRVPYVRSMDTSMPFNYAWAGISMDRQPELNVPRPPHKEYFDLQTLDYNLAAENCRTMLRWANA